MNVRDVRQLLNPVELHKDETFDWKCGRSKPHQHLNVDQSPLPFATDTKRIY